MKRCILSFSLLAIANITLLFSEDFPGCGITPTEMAGILMDEGYRAKIHYADSDDKETYIDSSTQGYIFSVYFYDIADENRARSIEYCISFKPDERIDNNAVLEWNRKYRYARMYLSKSNTSYFEMDRDVSRGLTRAAIENDIERWESLISSILEFIGKKTTNNDLQPKSDV